MRGNLNRNQPGMVRAQGRKRANRALTEENLRGEAMQLGITIHEHKQNQFAKVQELRRNPAATPDWVNPWAIRR